MPKAHAKDLLFVSKSDKKTIDGWKAGASLQQRTGYLIDELRIKATADRIKLSQKLCIAAKATTQGKNRSYWSAASRAYYSMYHAFRATAFFVHEGDDHEEHAKLPSGIPPDFPGRATWENDLKGARLSRNRADYDPYPKNDLMFKVIAFELIKKAESLRPIVRSYLKTKGCPL
jgi:uncharacterized protein (UPF0332 family)